jgi:hypothetical protein
MVVVANLVICGGIVAISRATHQVAATPPASATTAEAPETTSPSPQPPATTDPTSGLGAGYEQIFGPGGMTTFIPAGWPTKTASGPGAMQADDPAGTSRMLRYGGSVTALTDSYDTHVDYERRFSADKADYVSLRLERTELRGWPAVDWEFEYDSVNEPRHVRSVYWLAGGYEYFVYASAPTGLWPDTQPVLDVMLTYSTP